MFYYFTVPFFRQISYFIKTIPFRKEWIIIGTPNDVPIVLLLQRAAPLLFDKRERLQHAPTISNTDDIVARTVALQRNLHPAVHDRKHKQQTA